MSDRLRPLPFGLGLIEGFYGRPWDERDRLAMLDFLASAGYHYYVYAPKSDTGLRRRWREPWPEPRVLHLRALAERARALGLCWGVGLSPLGLVESMDAGSMRALRARVGQLDDIGVEMLCVLFDDMPREVDDLALRQADIVAEIMAVARTRHLLVCPSYYSRDPVLERLFGERPRNYWESLGAQLPASVGVFWTGERVCSTAYPEEDLRDIAARLRRPPVLWDNYPVNDGARMADHLHVGAFRDRPGTLAGLVTAHFVNPMNQCWLSRIPLATLPRAYALGERYDADRAYRQACGMLAGEAAGLLEADLEAFQSKGRAGLDAMARAGLEARYGAIDAPWAREITGWLRGEYTFDPACLTD